MRKLILAALLAGTIATPAFAQDTASPFTGFRVEGLVGYDKLKSGDSNEDNVDTNDDDGDESLEGVAYGVGAGFDFDLGGIVAGIEAEYMDSTGKQEFDESIDDIDFSSRIGTGRDIYVGGRIGFRAAPSTLVYGKAGYTNLNIDYAAESEDDRYDFAGNVEGWRLGAGVEQLFGPNAYGKIEYRYSKYSNLDFSDDFDFEDIDGDDFDTEIDVDRHQVVAGFGFRF